MAGKRPAATDLNHDNWYLEEEPEDRGRFRTASAEEMKSRVIKKARRKVSGSTIDKAGDGPKGAFSQFTGFGKSTNSATSSSPFSFLSKLPVSSTNSATSKVLSSGSNNTEKDSEDGNRQTASDIGHDKLNIEEAEDRNQKRSTLTGHANPNVIKKGRRENEDVGDEPKIVFSGFGGLNKNTKSPFTISNSAATKTPFSFRNESVKDDEKPSSSTAAAFFSKQSSGNTTVTAADTNNTNQNFSLGEYGNTKAGEKSATIPSGALVPPTSGTLFSFSDNPSEVAKPGFGGKTALKDAVPLEKSIICNLSEPNGNKSSEFCAKLANLNRGITAWIKQHVDSNPICLLTPIFDDYKRFLKEIEDEEENRTPTFANSKFKFDDNSSKHYSIKVFQFNANNKLSLTSSGGTSITETKPLFSFGITPSAKKPITIESNEAKHATPVGIFSGFGSNTSDKKLEPPIPPGIFTFGAKPLNPTTPTPANTSIKSTFSFNTTPTATSADDNKTAPAKTGSNGFQFGIKPVASSPPVSNIAELDNAAKPFSFKANAVPFSFGNIKPPVAITPTTANAKETQDEEDTPPKVEFKQVVEDDAVYSKKCKVFVKKDDNFADHGVGTLHLKPVKDSGKTQLIVRADTNLGNILVNLILSEGIPSQRMGKNNVMLVCVPTPDVEKPTPTLFRVKTGDEADQLLEMIKKYTK